MTGGYQLTTARVLRVYCPVAADSLSALLAGDMAALERDPVLSNMPAVIRAHEALGDFGLYKAVMHLASGWELFTAGADAKPAFGKADAAAISPTVLITIVLPDANEEAVDRALAEIVAAHPWEVPVIEIGPTSLLRASA